MQSDVKAGAAAAPPVPPPRAAQSPGSMPPDQPPSAAAAVGVGEAPTAAEPREKVKEEFPDFGEHLIAVHNKLNHLVRGDNARTLPSKLCVDPSAVHGDEPPTRTEAFVGWGVFLLCMSAAWDRAMATAIEAVTEESDRLATPGAAPVTRGYVVALALFTAMRALFLLGLAMIMAFALLSCLNVIAPYLPQTKKLRAPVYNLTRPHIMFLPLSARHMSFHGTVLVTLMLCAFAMAATYFRAADLRDQGRVRSKCTHMVCAMAMIAAAAYTVYMVLQIAQAVPGSAEDEEDEEEAKDDKDEEDKAEDKVDKEDEKDDGKEEDKKSEKNDS